MTTTLDLGSLTDEQAADFLASPMSPAELDLLAVLEAEMKQAFLEATIAELAMGEHLHRLKEDPSLLWQRDPMFQTKKGGWVHPAKRAWDKFCKNTPAINMSGKEADAAIARWLAHQRALELEAQISATAKAG